MEAGTKRRNSAKGFGFRIKGARLHSDLIAFRSDDEPMAVRTCARTVDIHFTQSDPYRALKVTPALATAAIF